MYVNLVYFFFFNFFLFVESYPRYDSIARDLRIIRRCNESYPTDRTFLNVALVTKRFDREPDHGFKCFLHCLYENYEWMTEDGAFQGELMKETLAKSSLDEPSIEYLLATCTEIDVEDKCERAHSFTECFWSESDKLVSRIHDS